MSPMPPMRPTLFEQLRIIRDETANVVQDLYHIHPSEPCNNQYEQADAISTVVEKLVQGGYFLRDRRDEQVCLFNLIYRCY